jgi:hypothetical protein
VGRITDSNLGLSEPLLPPLLSARGGASCRVRAQLRMPGSSSGEEPAGRSEALVDPSAGPSFDPQVRHSAPSATKGDDLVSPQGATLQAMWKKGRMCVLL